MSDTIVPAANVIKPGFVSGLEAKLESIGTSLIADAQKAAALFSKVKVAWKLISSPAVRAIALKVTADAITLGKDATAAAGAEGVNLALDAQLLADIKTLWADAQAGDGVIVADLRALGIVK